MYQIKRKLFHLVILGSLAVLPFVSSEVSATQQPTTTSVKAISDDDELAWRSRYYHRGYSYYPRYYYYSDYSYPYYSYPYGGGYYYNSYPYYYSNPGVYFRFGW